MKTIVELITGIEKGNNKKFLIQKDNIITYGMLLDAVLKAIYLLQQHGFKQHDKIILSCGAEEDIIVFFLACLRSGITPILVDHTTKETRINAILKSAHPSGFIIDFLLKESWHLNENINCILIKRTAQKKYRRHK